MMRGLLFVCFLSFCHGGFVRLQNKDPKAILGDPSSDEYIDMILENLRKYIMDNNLDPMGLPDLETGFSDTILGITWHGTAWVTNKILIQNIFIKKYPIPLAERRSVLGPDYH